MAREGLNRLRDWLLEIEMGVVWGLAGVSIISFVFLAIWFIDPALLTLVLQFRQARCTTVDAVFLVGISNCTWTSCRLGCTREIFKCWQILVQFEFVQNAVPHKPPWAPLSAAALSKEDGEVELLTASDGTLMPSNTARLYPNVKGCGYPPELNCEQVQLQ